VCGTVASVVEMTAKGKADVNFVQERVVIVERLGATVGIAKSLSEAARTDGCELGSKHRALDVVASSRFLSLPLFAKVFLIDLFRAFECSD